MRRRWLRGPWHAASWRVSSDDMRLAGGILLFAAAREMIGQVGRAPSPPAYNAVSEWRMVTPLAIPVIVTPWGVTAILFFADLAYGDLRMFAVVMGILLLVMVLNLLGMLLARQIIAAVGMIIFQVMGW